MKNFILFLVVVVLFSCAEENRNEKIEKYFKQLNIRPNSSIAILNTNFCGSCAEYSINWLEKINIRKKLYLQQENCQKNTIID